jgi:hypothetical protein
MIGTFMRVAAGALLAAAFLAGCESTPQVGSDADRSANFAGYHSFALVPRNRVVMSFPPDALHNPLVVSRIEDEIKQGLQTKGYTLESDPLRADLAVDFTIGAQERIDVRSVPGGWGVGPMWAGTRWGSDIDVRQYREGTLAIDVFDVKTRRPVWHGWAQKELSRKDIEQSATPIHDAVESILAKFPSS